MENKALTANKSILAWLDKQIELVKPARIDGRDDKAQPRTSAGLLSAQNQGK